MGVGVGKTSGVALAVGVGGKGVAEALRVAAASGAKVGAGS